MSGEFELIERESTSMLDQAREMSVTCDEEYSECGDFILGCKALIVKIADAHSSNIARWHQGHKAALADRDNMLQPVNQALELASNVAMKYKREMDRLAKDERDRIDAEKRKADEEARLKEAERLEAEGKTKEAEQVLDAPPPPPARPTKFVSPAPKVAGLSTKKTWKARIVDPGKVTINYRNPDIVLINRKVQSFFAYAKDPSPAQIKALEDEIGGVVLEKVETFAGRVAR